jgi:cyclopropane-fatty-acyl-phospholipid synthase
MFLRVVFQNFDSGERPGPVLGRLPRPLREMVRRSLRHQTAGAEHLRTKERAPQSEEFFTSFLDPTLTFSSAVFPTVKSGLEEAQVNKFDRLCKKLSIGPADHLLEIGAGFGGFALHAAEAYGCHVTATTRTPLELAVLERRVREAGLEELVTVAGDDLSELAGPFDKLVSVECLEHLTNRDQEAVFDASARLLRDDALVAIQTTVVPSPFAPGPRGFLKRYGFGGANQMAIGQMIARAAHSHLALIDCEDLTNHYAETVRRWRSTYLASTSAQQSDESFVRLFEFWLSYLEAGFSERRNALVQCIFARPKWRARGLSLPG